MRFSHKGDTKASTGHASADNDTDAPSPPDSTSTTTSGSGQLNTYAPNRGEEIPRLLLMRDTAPVSQDTGTPAKECSSVFIKLRSGPEKPSTLVHRRLTWGDTGGADGWFDDAARSSSLDSFHARNDCWFHNRRPGYRSTGITSTLTLVLVASLL